MELIGGGGVEEAEIESDKLVESGREKEEKSDGEKMTKEEDEEAKVAAAEEAKVEERKVVKRRSKKQRSATRQQHLMQVRSCRENKYPSYLTVHDLITSRESLSAMLVYFSIRYTGLFGSLNKMRRRGGLIVLSGYSTI
jgi:hypothetical protein